MQGSLDGRVAFLPGRRSDGFASRSSRWHSTHPLFGPDAMALGDSVEHWIMDGARLVALVVFPSYMSGRCRIWVQSGSDPACMAPPYYLHEQTLSGDPDISGEHRIFAPALMTTTVIRAAPGPAAALWLAATASAPAYPSGWQSAVVEAPRSWAAVSARKRWR
jgi:hypothetical protein